MVKLCEKIPELIKESIHELESFHSVKNIDDIKVHDTHVAVKATWVVVLPNKFQKKGVTDTGVKTEEDVYWFFPFNYPISAPKPFLRANFSKNNPHINPYKKGKLTNPCISDMQLEDLLHSEGFNALLNAMNDWLFNAAANNLHSPIQGWEPIVRNDKGILFSEVNKIKSELDTNSIYARYYRYEYKYLGDSNEIIIGNLHSSTIGHANSTLKGFHFGVIKETQKQFSIGLLLKTKEVVDFYNVEEISNYADLHKLIKSLGLTAGFQQRINYIGNKLAHRERTHLIPDEILIILAIKRPFHLIGSSSSFELLSYRVVIKRNNKGGIDDDSQVIPTTLMQQSNAEILRKVSGSESHKITKITMLGCGSLGSKLTLHLAKSGQYQFQLVDDGYMSTHNNARHGLILGSTDSVLSLFNNKAQLLQVELEKLGCPVSSDDKNILSIGSTKGLKINKSSVFIFDTTASLSVRYFLTHSCKKLPARLIHTVLYGKAKMGVIATEGKDRSVRTDDIIAYMEMLSIESEQIRSILFKSKDTDKHDFSDGCSSYTTVMKDTDISYLTSGMSIQIDQQLTDPISDDGGLIIGLVDDIYNLEWETHTLPSTKVIDRYENNGWEVRIIGGVAKTIASQSQSFPGKENGGALMGQTCHFSKTIYITSLIDAPANSVRTKDRFYLSVAEITPIADSISDKTNNKIKFLGTWHSHTASEPPSELDKSTLEKLDSASAEPAVMLVYVGGEIVTVPRKNMPPEKSYA